MSRIIVQYQTGQQIGPEIVSFEYDLEDIIEATQDLKRAWIRSQAFDTDDNNEAFSEAEEEFFSACMKCIPLPVLKAEVLDRMSIQIDNHFKDKETN